MRKIKEFWGKFNLKEKIVFSVITLVLLAYLVIVLLYVNSSFYFAMKFEKILEDRLFDNTEAQSANWTFGEDETSFYFTFYECNSDEDVMEYVDLWNQFAEEHPYYARRTGIVIMEFYDGELYEKSQEIAEVMIFNGEQITDSNMNWS